MHNLYKILPLILLFGCSPSKTIIIEDAALESPAEQSAILEPKKIDFQVNYKMFLEDNNITELDDVNKTLLEAQINDLQDLQLFTSDLGTSHIYHAMGIPTFYKKYNNSIVWHYSYSVCSLILLFQTNEDGTITLQDSREIITSDMPANKNCLSVVIEDHALVSKK